MDRNYAARPFSVESWFGDAMVVLTQAAGKQTQIPFPNLLTWLDPVRSLHLDNADFLTMISISVFAGFLLDRADS
ncbi:hypothetical protein QCA50_004971 [Cerrena zonata]|uniref:Uncharacterized protein n=1 Tax=Cerrena zonata TaxID=2478898 RepID=A0AAW0GNV4_9APHY